MKKLKKVNDNYSFLEEVNEQLQQYFIDLEKELKRIWMDTIDELIYYREPKYYFGGTRRRTYQLENSLKVEIKGDMIYVYVDTDNMNYYSFDDRNKPVPAENVVHFIDVGHDSVAPFEGDYDYFYHYPAKHIIEEFANRVKSEYPEFNIEVVRDTPPIV